MGFELGASAETSGTKETEKGTKRATGSRTEQLKLDEAAIDKIIQDVLSQAGGLKDIFSGEQTAGLFGSSVSAQAAGDLAAKLAGEIAKLTGKTEILTQEDEEQSRIRDSRTTDFATEGKFDISF